MKLMTKELEKRFAEVGEQSNEKNPLIIAKYFSPIGAATWYASEYNPKTNICFGYVRGLVPNENDMYDEWGYFSIEELESVNLPLGLKIERDIHFDETRFEELVPPKPEKRKAEIKELKDKGQKQDRNRT